VVTGLALVGALIAGFAALVALAGPLLAQTSSSDPGRIVFSSDRNATSGNSSDLYTMKPDGTDVQRLTNRLGYEWWPSISHDGKKVAFMGNAPSGYHDIYTVDAAEEADESQVTNVTKNATNDNGIYEEYPSWSPEGKVVFQGYLYDANNTGNYEAFQANADGTSTTPTNLTQTPTINEQTPAMSPDGKKIAYVNSGWSCTYTSGTNDVTYGYKCTGDFDIYTTNTDRTGEPTNLTSTPSSYSHEDGYDSSTSKYFMKYLQSEAVEAVPAWSPDGQQIAYAQSTNKYGRDCSSTDNYFSDDECTVTQPYEPSSGIYKMNASDGSGSTLVAKNTEFVWDVTPSFSPDGTEIAFGTYGNLGDNTNPERDYEIFKVKADGSAPTAPENLTQGGTRTYTDSDGQTHTYPSGDFHPRWGKSASEPDEKKPITQVTATTSDNASYSSDAWTNKTVTVSLKAADDPGEQGDTVSGIQHLTYKAQSAQDVEEKTVALEPGDTSSEISAQLEISEEGTTTVTAYATDKAGNPEAPPQVFTVKIDKSAPTVTLEGGSITDGSTYYYGDTPSGPTSCNAQDNEGGSGLPEGTSCAVSGYDTTVGKHTITTNAIKDNAGNEAKVQNLSYQVLAWTLKGFYQPTDMDTSTAKVVNTVKNGSTVPLKFEVFKGTTELTDTSKIKSFTATPIGCITGIAEDAVELTSTGGTALRYDAAAGQFIQNWQTPKKPGACYDVKLTTLDGTSVPVAHFKLK
jgi:Tol biopolymer transport system component